MRTTIKSSLSPSKVSSSKERNQKDVVSDPSKTSSSSISSSSSSFSSSSCESLKPVPTTFSSVQESGKDIKHDEKGRKRWRQMLKKEDEISGHKSCSSNNYSHEKQDENYISRNEYHQQNEEDEKRLLQFMFQISSGMEFISKHGIIHRDLASRNVLVSKDWTCKIADFGLARCIKDPEVDAYESKTKGALPIRWMSPEALFDRTFSSKSDVWSFGVVVWEIITFGSTPYPGLSSSDVAFTVRNGQYMDKPDHCSDTMYKLMKDCWSMAPDDRPSFCDLKRRIQKLIDNQNGYLDFNQFYSHLYNNVKLSDDERV